MTITVHSTGAERHFDHPVCIYIYIYIFPTFLFINSLTSVIQFMTLL